MNNNGKQQQQQFPPPPPYSPDATITTAAAAIRGGTAPPNNVVIEMPPQQQQQLRTTAASAATCSSCQVKLRRALLQFRVYKRALASTLWFSSFFTVYLFFLFVTFPDMRYFFFALMMPCVCAILGVLCKQTLLLFPLLIEQLIGIGTLLAFLMTTIYLSIEQPIAWETFLQDEFKVIMRFLGLNIFQMTISMVVFFCLDILCLWIVSLDVMEAIKGMSKHCNKVHKIALSMAGLTTDFSDPILVQHLRMHITERINAKNACD